MTSRERLLNILHGRPADRPSVLCPGGMMSMAVTEVMTAETTWPRSHVQQQAMGDLALAMQDASGFDNLALPFCMTLEAEAYGAQVNFGDAVTQPRVTGPILPPDGSGRLPIPDFRSGRPAMVLGVMGRLKAERPEVALLGNLAGPFSILGELVDARQLLKWTLKRPQEVRNHAERIAADLIEFGKLQVASGADAVCVAEPTATGEILGGELFREFALPWLNRIADELQAAGVPVIVHICGDVRRIEAELFSLSACAASFDSMVDLPALIEKRPPWQAMGNVSPFLLEKGPVESIARHCRRLIEAGVRLLAPACGVVPTTPLSHLKAMRDAAVGLC